MDLEGINKAVSSNQMRGQNSVVLARLMAKATRNNRSSAPTTGMSKKDLENQAELMRHASELRRGEVANKAWVETQASERAAEFSVDNMPRRIEAFRKASEITDDEGKVVGELNITDSMHKMASRGYRLIDQPKETALEEAPSGTGADNQAAAAAVADTVPPQASGQQGTNIPGWGTPAPTQEPAVTSTQLRSAMAKGPKKRVTKKAQKQTQLTFSDAAPSTEESATTPTEK